MTLDTALLIALQMLDQAFLIALILGIGTMVFGIFTVVALAIYTTIALSIHLLLIQVDSIRFSALRDWLIYQLERPLFVREAM